MTEVYNVMAGEFSQHSIIWMLKSALAVPLSMVTLIIISRVNPRKWNT